MAQSARREMRIFTTQIYGFETLPPGLIPVTKAMKHHPLTPEEELWLAEDNATPIPSPLRRGKFRMRTE